MFLVPGLFIAGGVAAFKMLPVEAFPDVTDTQVQVITFIRARQRKRLKRKVTVPVEIGLSGIPHSVRLFSHTMFGLSFVVVTFDDGVDAYFARQQIIERLQALTFRMVSNPIWGPMATPIGEIYRYRLKGGQHQPDGPADRAGPGG